MFPAEVKQSGALPSVSAATLPAAETLAYLDHVSFAFSCFLLPSLFKVAPESSAKVLSRVLKHEVQKIHVSDKMALSSVLINNIY